VGFHINAYSMPSLGTYDNAKEFFNNNAPIRGENQSIRRLGDRYAKEKWIRQEIQEGVEVYIAGYYNTDLVKFLPTHKEITLGGFPSYSSKRFVERVANQWLVEFEHKKYVPAPFTRQPNVVNNDIECALSLNGYHYMNANNWYRIDYDGNTDDEQYIKPMKCQLDTSQMRELRKPYRTLIKYIDTIIKLGNAGVEHDAELIKQLPDMDNGYANMLEFMKHENNMYLSQYYLIRQTQHRVYHRTEGGKYHVTIGMVKRYLDKLLKLENPQVLVEVQPTDKPIK
jgi:hypothetical protein